MIVATSQAGADRTGAARHRLIAIPWLAVGGALAVLWGLLAATANQFGYFPDELYFRMLPPDWGYVDQPPLTPLLVRASIAVFGDTPAGLRVPAMLLAGLGVVLSVLITRELGGDRRAQALCAWGVAFSVYSLGLGHQFVTINADVVAWAAALLFVTRALLRAEPRWWLMVGVTVGLATYNKLLIALLVVSLVVALLLVGPRSALRDRHLWAGAGIAFVLALPNVVYQVSHDFPQLQMISAMSGSNAEWVRWALVPSQFLVMGVLAAPVWIAGLVALWRRDSWRLVRHIAVAYLVGLVLIFVGGGQYHHVMGVQAFLLAAGFAVVPQWLGAKAWRRPAFIGALALNAVLNTLVTLPVTPSSSPLAAINGDQIGWPSFVQQVADTYHDLPDEDRERAVIFAGNYAEAGAIARFGAEHGLPAVYSGNNQLWFYGPPPADRTVVVAWYRRDERVAPFTDCVVKATLHNVERVGYEDGSRVAVCRLPAAGWASVWPQLRFYGAWPNY
jgi:hypothetical protein